MTAPDVIRVQYDELSTLPALFSDEAERARAATAALRDQVALLQGGAWEGPAADTFYAAMTSDVLPGMTRLIAALVRAGEFSAEAVAIFAQAEEDAARIEWGGDEAVGVAGRGGGGGAAGDSMTAPVPFGSGRPVQVAWQNPSTPPQPAPDPGDAAGRSEEYARWDAAVSGLGIRFYRAASSVTALLGLAERNDALTFLGELFTYAPNEGARWFLNIVGQVLYELNTEIYTGLLNGDYTTPDGELLSPLTDEVVPSGLDWDVHMVFVEQKAVEEILQAAIDMYGWGFAEVGVSIDQLLRYGLEFGGLLEDARYMENPTFLGWAWDAIRANDPMYGAGPGQIVFDGPSFASIDHRRALGIALIFQEHGYTYDDYMNYMAGAWAVDVPPPIGLTPTGGAGATQGGQQSA